MYSMDARQPGKFSAEGRSIYPYSMSVDWPVRVGIIGLVVGGQAGSRHTAVRLHPVDRLPCIQEG